MSVRTGKAASRQQPSPVVVAIVVVALVAFIAWRGWVAFAGPRAGKLPPPPTQEINFINAKAKECLGDFSKLSPADQAKVQQITHGFGQASMVSTWRELSKKTE